MPVRQLARNKLVIETTSNLQIRLNCAAGRLQVGVLSQHPRVTLPEHYGSQSAFAQTPNSAANGGTLAPKRQGKTTKN